MTHLENELVEQLHPWLGAREGAAEGDGAAHPRGDVLRRLDGRSRTSSRRRRPST